MRRGENIENTNFMRLPAETSKTMRKRFWTKLMRLMMGVIRHTQFADNISMLAERYNAEREINDLKVLIEPLKAE